MAIEKGYVVPGEVGVADFPFCPCDVWITRYVAA